MCPARTAAAARRAAAAGARVAAVGVAGQAATERHDAARPELAAPAMTPDTPATRRLDGLRVIALFKFGKAVLLLVTVFGVHELLRPEVSRRLYDWSTTLTDDTARDYAQRILDWLTGPGFRAVSRAQWVTLGYIGLVLVEGVGLWRRNRWAEWLVVVAGACLIPVELWELSGSSNHKLIVAAAMALNIAVVWYLAVQLRRTRAARAG